MEKFNAKTRLATICYQAAYAALLDLDPGGKWTKCYKPLNLSTDLHLPRRELDDPHKGRNEGENKRTLSWIWLVASDSDHADATEEEVRDGKLAYCLLSQN